MENTEVGRFNYPKQLARRYIVRSSSRMPSPRVTNITAGFPVD